MNEKNGLNVKVKVEKVECNGLATKSETDDAVNEVGHHVEDLYEIEESLWDTEKSEDNVYSSLRKQGKRKTKKPSTHVCSTIGLEDVKNLRPGKWLNDECMNFYINVLKLYKTTCSGKRNIYFNTFFFS